MQKITLNLIPDGVPPVVYVNQFDTGREFQISFKEGLSPYNFPSGVVFRINGRKADNHVFEYTESDKWDASHNIITKSGSGTSLTVTIATSEQMTAAAGEAEVQLTFKSSSASNDILGTLNFILAVQEKPDANGDPSESDLPDRVESVNGIGPDANGNVLLPPAQGAIGAHNIATVEPTRIMSTARAAGTQVYVTADDQLYDIISSIGSGGTLTPGTNAIASSISSDLVDLDYHSATISSLNNTLFATAKILYNRFWGFATINAYWSTAISIPANTWYDIGKVSCSSVDDIRSVYYNPNGETRGLCRILGDGTIQLLNNNGSAMSIREVYFQIIFPRV